MAEGILAARLGVLSDARLCLRLIRPGSKPVEKSPLPVGGAAAGPPGCAGGGVGPLRRFGGPKSLKSKGIRLVHVHHPGIRVRRRWEFASGVFIGISRGSGTGRTNGPAARRRKQNGIRRWRRPAR